ncbi:MAG: DEAD/DEAH box helicase [Myxococcota bacterium]
MRHRERFEAVSWATLVLDEAHAMKNATTRRAGGARHPGRLRASAHRHAGREPAERALELVPGGRAPGLLGSAESFRDTFAAPIQNGDSEAPRRLARLVRPFILRRKKVEVAADLPAKSEVRVDVVLGGDERARYEKVRKAVLAELAKDDAHPLDGGRGVIKVLSVLTRLRQLACHPRLVDPHAPATSAKLERLMELVQELRDEGRRTLVFSQFTELLGLVRTAFDEAGVSYAYLDGSTPAERREVEIDTFQSGAVDAFLLSLKAGGVGLNLTAASEVIHLDPWWNPAAEDQATDRAHRIGQDKPVTLYRLVAQGTIEEQILGLHGDKRRMVASLLEGTGSAAALTVDELMALLTEAPDDDALRAPTARSAP